MSDPYPKTHTSAPSGIADKMAFLDASRSASVHMRPWRRLLPAISLKAPRRIASRFSIAD